MQKPENIYSDSTEKHPELPANIALAISYLKKSARLGNHLAIYSLGKLFSDPDSLFEFGFLSAYTCLPTFVCGIICGKYSEMVGIFQHDFNAENLFTYYSRTRKTR